MARLIVVFALALGLMGAAFASAAQLDIKGGTVQAGTDSTLACAASPVEVVAWAVNTYPEYEGLDWVTVKLTESDASTCAGAELTGRVALTGGDFAYVGAYYSGWGSMPAVTPVVPIVASQTEYKLGFWNRAWNSKVWVDPEKVEALKLWLGGPAS